MNKLRNHSIYLAGPMDRVPDGGIVWRQDITPFLKDLGVVVLDPTNKLIHIAEENAEMRANLERLKDAGNFDEVARIVRIIRSVDLRMVDLCSAVIAYLDLDLHPCGTYEEIFWGNRMKKPILVMCKQGKRHMPGWMFGVSPHEMFFDTWDELKQYIIQVDSGHITHKRWMLFNF